MLKVIVTFVLCLSLLLVGVLWTEYAYNEGVKQATYMECEMSDVR